MNDLDHSGEKQRCQREKNLTLLPHFHLQMVWNWGVWVRKREKDGKERGGRREEENYVGISKKLIRCWNRSNAQLSWYFGEDGEWAYSLRAFQVSCPHSAPRGKSCTGEGMQTHRGGVIGPHHNWERTIFPRTSSSEIVSCSNPHRHTCTAVVFPVTSGSQQCIPSSGIVPENKHGSLTEPPPVLQFPVDFLEASGTKSILSIGPSTRCGNGSSTSWTPTSWTPAASLSKSLTSTASTSATWACRSSPGRRGQPGSSFTATCSTSSGTVTISFPILLGAGWEGRDFAASRIPCQGHQKMVSLPNYCFQDREVGGKWEDRHEA